MNGELPWPLNDNSEEYLPFPLGRSSEMQVSARWVKGVAEYSALRAGAVVEVTARGTFPNFNMEARLIQSAIAVFPPQFALLFLTPDVVLPAQRPFVTCTSFVSADRVEKVIVWDRNGKNEVVVDVATG